MDEWLDERTGRWTVDGGWAIGRTDGRTGGRTDSGWLAGWPAGWLAGRIAGWALVLMKP